MLRVKTTFIAGFFDPHDGFFDRAWVVSALAWGLSLDVPLDVALAFTLVGWKVDPSAKRLDLDVAPKSLPEH